MTPQPHHRRHDVSVAVVCYSTLLTWVTVLKRQPVSDANESWPTTTHLSRPFPFATVISWAEIFMEEYVPYWIMHGGEDSWLFLAFISLIQVSLSCYFWINELCTVYHFVRSPHQLMSELWLAATQLHATQNRTGPILSTCITCGSSKPSNALWHGFDFELAHGVNSTKFMSICSCVACGCGCGICPQWPLSRSFADCCLGYTAVVKEVDSETALTQWQILPFCSLDTSIFCLGAF